MNDKWITTSWLAQFGLNYILNDEFFAGRTVLNYVFLLQKLENSIWELSPGKEIPFRQD